MHAYCTVRLSERKDRFVSEPRSRKGSLCKVFQLNTSLSRPRHLNYLPFNKRRSNFIDQDEVSDERLASQYRKIVSFGNIRKQKRSGSIYIVPASEGWRLDKVSIWALRDTEGSR
jgi:hypothetical protein